MLFLLLSTALAFAAPETHGKFTGFFRSLHSQTPYGYRIVHAPEPVRAGEESERFELHSGDCSGNEAWNDCTHDRERTELIQGKPYIPVDQAAWFGWSIYVPADYPNIFPVKVALGQFHQEGAEHPALMFQNDDGGYWADLNQIGQPHALLVPDSELRGRWHDVLVHARWSASPAGVVQIWIDGRIKFTHRGANLNDGQHPLFFKYGIYRSFLSRAQGKPLPNQVVYFDEVKWGARRSEVETPSKQAQARSGQPAR